jgi:RNA ligase (TIGR02306 family)
MPQYTDIQHVQRYSRNLDDGEPVVITEKIHGSNARFGWINKAGALVWLVGSRQVIKAREWEYGWRTPWKWLEAKFKSWVFKQTKKHYYMTDVWSAAAKKYGLKQKLRQYPGLIFYGEVYGDGIQDLKYGLVGEQRVAFFDVYDTVEGKYLDYYTSDLLFDTLGLPKAPLLYRGGWDHDVCYALMTGPSHVEPSQIREGFVVRPTVDRVSHSGRVIYKGINPDYLLRQGGTEFH